MGATDATLAHRERVRLEHARRRAAAGGGRDEPEGAAGQAPGDACTTTGIAGALPTGAAKGGGWVWDRLRSTCWSIPYSSLSAGAISSALRHTAAACMDRPCSR
ncbi:MAG: hypothetical protein HS111_15930 [Kofleriaceae bacterium]|nr:hypothetical protein [Kofleriaceae bacterium]